MQRTEEHARLQTFTEVDSNPLRKAYPWKKWGAYLSERQWGTVREDYSSDGNSWKYLTHDMARSYAYRFGEDGIAGISDQFQEIVFSLALWNGKDPILKERLFGLDPFEGNHAEDVKECYYYLDATPTHSYLKYLYKYPQNAFPYNELVEKNKLRTTHDREYEITDTDAFKNNEYFDVFIEYAKETPDDIAIRIEVCNRSTQDASIHLIPQVWFRKQWGWNPEKKDPIPVIVESNSGKDFQCLKIDPTSLHNPARSLHDYTLEEMYMYGPQGGTLLFTDNETNWSRFGKQRISSQCTKDAFHRHIINGEECTNSENRGTKACILYPKVKIDALSSYVLHLRLSNRILSEPLKDVDGIVKKRKNEADTFYESIQNTISSNEEKSIQRSAISGMIWNQQYYFYDVALWLAGDDPHNPPPPARWKIRNEHWLNFYANNIISMPDKWEYPWFAAWDLAFHTVVYSLFDIDFAKNQLILLLTHRLQNPSGQIPAYEWRFCDLNPPVQAWALWSVYNKDKELTGKSDYHFLESGFVKLVTNFCWWVNKVDKNGNNFFEGGFLGLDNISIIDRSKPLPDGGTIEQSDGTGWMGFFALHMMEISLELAKTNSVYEMLATIFFEHFVYITSAITKNKIKSIELWDEKDGFFYDLISYPDGNAELLKIRSLVGLVPFFSMSFLDEEYIKQFKVFYENFHVFINNHKELISRSVFELPNTKNKRYLLAMMPLDKINKVLEKTWSPQEFRSPFGLRSLSKYHELHPFIYDDTQVRYEPGESLERIKGGNSNWRGPVWIPPAFLFIDALKKLSFAINDSMSVKAQNEKPATLNEIADYFTNAIISLFCKDAQGNRPIHGDLDIYAKDPYWKDLVLFYEHFHAETGRGLGASHQTGWSGLVANLIDAKSKVKNLKTK